MAKKYTKEETKELVEKAIPTAFPGDLRKLFWISLFNKKRAIRILDGLDNGKHIHYAIIDSKK